MVLLVMAFTFRTEGFGVGVESAINAFERLVVHPELLQPTAERGRIRRFLRTETAIAAAIIGRAKRAAAGMGDGTKAWRAMGDHNAGVALKFALYANAMRRRRGASTDKKGAENLDQLMLVDRAATQLEINAHMIGNRRRCRVAGARTGGLRSEVT